jgi:LDH2 family malate/lactate/ureidoglycolate dehydrogenase
MKVSFNELESLSRKAFIGMGFSDGQAADAADMLCWMESLGFEGLKALSDALAQYSLEHPHAPPERLYQDTDVTVLDAHNASVLACSHLPLELTFAKARARGLSILKIRRCRQRQLIMGYLARLANRGMNITAFWRNSQQPLTEQVVGFRANSSVPSIRIYAVSEVPEETQENTGISIVMANHVDLLPTMRSDYEYNLLAKHDEAELLDARSQSGSRGITVDDALWATLNQFAKLTLVESTGNSRLRAGPAD